MPLLTHRYILFVVSLLVLLSMNRNLEAQCSSVSFESAETICLNQSILLNNTSADPGGARYSWDFCEGDLSGTLAARSIKQVLDAAGPAGISLVKDKDNFFLFLAGRTSNNLIRFDFGPDPNNTEPVVVNLGNPGNVLKGPVGIKVHKEKEEWHAIVYNSLSDSLVRIDFGTLLTNPVPRLQNVVKAYGSSNANSGLDLGVSEGEVVVAITSPVTNRVTLISFGNSITNTPTDPADILTTSPIAGAGSLRGITLRQICGQWYGFSVASSSRTIYRLEFGSTLFSVPVITNITGTFSDLVTFQDIRVLPDAGLYVGFILTSQGSIYRLDFGNDIMALPQKVNLGNLEVIASPIRFDFVNHNSKWNFFTANSGTRILYRADFANVCSANSQTASVFEPSEIKYGAPGLYNVTLQVQDPSTGFNSVTKQITVENKLSPQIDFDNIGVCAAHDVEFTLTSDNEVSEFDWDFGDGESSAVESPVHRFEDEGDYKVQLSATAENGCENTVTKWVTIYNPPQANFSFPPGILCTNNEVTISTATPDTYKGNLAYEWLVDWNRLSSERDLIHTFTNTGTKQVTLITSIPGCSTEITKTISMVEAGPVVDFSFTGICADESFGFQEAVPEPVESYLWDFGNGQSSTEPNPQFAFDMAGDFEVSLTATNSTGCENVKTKTVTAHASPVVDFHLPGAPNACSGSSALFLNQTVQPDGTPITAWLWEFGDPLDANIATDADTQHNFAEPGIYQVSLTATTLSGCDATLGKAVVIERSPSTDFTFTPACDDKPMQFSGPVDEIATWYWEVEGVYYANASPTHTFRAPGDYPVYLQVTAANNCSSEITRTVSVPVPLSPDFTVLKNCVGHEAIFTALSAGIDPVVLQEWDFSSDEHYTGSPVTHTFVEQGTNPISLKVTTVAGCSYHVNKIVNVLPPPGAAFSADPVVGAFPLEVNFTNNSAYATKYSWRFSDRPDETSTEISPVHTFTDAGEYEVTLKAFNDQQCEDSTSTLITTVDPLPDVEIEMITVTPNTDGSWKMIINLHNKGNTVLKDIPVDIDFQGTLVLRHTAHDRILPGSKYNIVFSTGILNIEELRYVCASIDLEDDRSPAGNRFCREFENSFLLFPGYPNPAKDMLNLEWIAPMSSNVRISLIDAMGRRVLDSSSAGVPGFNQVTLDLSALRDGIYYLLVDDGTSRNTQRILLSSRP